MVVGCVNGHKRMCSFCSFCCTKRRSSQLSSPLLEEKIIDEESLLVHSEEEISHNHKKPGWKAMPYILGNATSERLASFGVTANFMVYLMKEYNMDQVFASNILNTWLAVCNVIPVFGAFIADSYLGKFQTIVTASFATLLGMMILTLTDIVPNFHPAPCTPQQQKLGECVGHNEFQLDILFLALFWLAIGSGGIRPCSVPFAIEQFDVSTVEGRKGTVSFFTWFYSTQTVILLIAQTILVYIQDSVSWTVGFGLPTLFMAFAIVLFYAGSGVYSCVMPRESVFSSIAQVLLAAKRKRCFHLPPAEDSHGHFYDPPLEGDSEPKLPLTEDFRWLNKAALVVDNELKDDDGSSRDPWRLCSVQQVEEFKCLLKIVPVWITSIICYFPMAQQGTFPVSQALRMDRHLGPTFEIPAGSISVVSLLTIAAFLPFYDKVISVQLAKITKEEGGLTTLQKIGLGHAFGVLTLVVSGIVEQKRRTSAISQGAEAISVMWLAPQFILLAFAEVFYTVGLTEFYNKESPDNMRSMGNSLLCLTVSGASYLSSLIVNIVHNFTARQGQPDWLDNDINKGRLEYYYYILAGLMVMNFGYFIFIARRYSYKIINAQILS
ncbi:hypothetical protein L6164_027156 [Bauhinia variegata]|uniref:Uncharacterized protein n=1 Tax=Bauhinia variegata TaxID=167791 RepID=A0ACB9LT21_BAUVA|nr:hypothetical protein L6164_027156 [Bauhinia variegata]